MNKKERKSLAESQKAMQDTYGQIITKVSCKHLQSPQNEEAEIEFHRSPGVNSISVNVNKCPYAKKRGGHGGIFCTKSHDWCQFCFDYPYVVERGQPEPFADRLNVYWQPPEQIKSILVTLISLFGIKEKGRPWS